MKGLVWNGVRLEGEGLEKGTRKGRGYLREELEVEGLRRGKKDGVFGTEGAKK